MSSLIKFAELDLRSAFDFAIMIEEDAQDRYRNLALRLGNDPGGAGEVFRMMIGFEGNDRDRLIERRNAVFRDAPPRIDVSVLDEGVESPEVDDELPTTARAALEVALAAERRAHAFYADVLPQITDPDVRSLFETLKQDEAEHAAILARKIAALGEAPAGDEVGPRVAPEELHGAAERFPDRVRLLDALPHFDAATQAVAVGVIVKGMSAADVAVALGVSRRAVVRKLAGFLAIARRHAAVAALAATLTTGCAGPLTRGGASTPHSAGEPMEQPQVTAQAPVAPPPAPAPVAAAPRHDPKSLAGKVHATVASRMRLEEPAVRESVAKAVVAEATRAALDPLLVLALIHVESSFDPEVVSHAGAVGLMQLLEPTMRRELERSQLPAADPRDPVANVQAGVRYLKRLVNAFGDVDVALMAYNAGPNRIRGYMKSGEIPDRFHVYPRKVRGELERLRASMGAGGAASMMASADVAPRPRG